MPAAAESRSRETREAKAEREGRDARESTTRSRRSDKESRAEKVERLEKQERSEKPERTSESTNTKREIYYAPESAVEALAPFIRDFKAIWDPASGPSEQYPLKDVLERLGHRVVISDVLMGKEYDFFTHKTKKRYEMIVTTPPYSYRKEFILRALDLKKPFALLVPTNVLESKTIRDMLRQYNISLIFPPKSTTFTSPEDSRSVKALPYSMWVLHGVQKVPPVVYL